MPTFEKLWISSFFWCVCHFCTLKIGEMATYIVRNHSLFSMYEYVAKHSRALREAAEEKSLFTST